MKREMALAMRVECDEESNGFGGKSDGNKCGRRLTVTRAMATAMATMWVMETVTRLAGDKEGERDEAGNSVGNKGGVRRRE